MKEFFIVAVVFTIFAGLPLGSLLACSLKKWKRGIITIIIAIVFGVFCSGLMISEKQGEQKTWNNGYCTCGTKWTLQNVEHIKNSENRYYWYCDNCNAIIETHYNFAKKNQK